MANAEIVQDLTKGRIVGVDKGLIDNFQRCQSFAPEMILPVTVEFSGPSDAMINRPEIELDGFARAALRSMLSLGNLPEAAADGSEMRNSLGDLVEPRQPSIANHGESLMQEFI